MAYKPKRKYKPKQSKEKVLAAIDGSHGVMSVVAKRLSVSWHTAEGYVERWEETRRAWQNEKELILDLAESKAHQAINDGDTSMIKWYLSKKGKDRGYGDSIEVSGPEGKPVALNLSALTNDELRALSKVYEDAEEKESN